MTRADRQPWMDTVDPVAIDAVRARWRRGMPDADLERLALALTVPHERCGVPAGTECRSYTDDGEVRFGFHLDRGRDAGVTWEPTTPREVAYVPPRSRRDANDWPEVPPPGESAAAEQGWRR